MRILLMITAVILTAIAFVFQDYFRGTIYLAIGMVLFYGYFSAGSVYTALNCVKKGRIEKAKILLAENDKISSHLMRQHKAYYYFLKGFFAMEEKNEDEAESFFLQALENGMKTENDKAMICLNLSKIYYNRHEIEKARQYINMAKQYEHKHEVGKLITEMKKKL